MKEIEGQTHIKGLTSQAAKMYSYVSVGDNSMAEAKGEVNTRTGPIGTARESQVFQNPLTHSHESIRNPQLKQYVSGFEQKMQQKPISDWNTEELKAAYFDTSRFTSRLGTPMEFGEREGLYADIQPLNNLIAGELERKGVDLKKLFLENQTQLRREGLPKGGVGAPGPTDNKEPDKGPAFKDKVAAEIWARFRMEHGESDPRTNQQLRNDLSKRIEDLTREQWDLGDSDEIKTPEGKAKVDAKIDELNDRISEIYGFFGSQEVGRRGDPVANELITRSREFVRGIRARGLSLDQINNLTESTKLTPGEQTTRENIVREIKEYIEKSPSLESSDFNSDILLAVRYFKELREELVSEIMFKSFEDRSETNDYEVNLYADSNLNTLLGFMNKDDNKRYKDFYSLRTATRFFQSMNATVLKGTFDSFGQAAENINYQHFENMRDIRGSGLAMRLYEQAYKDVLASDQRVQQEKIAGIKAFVEERFKEINDAGLIKSEFSQYRKDSRMEDWEIKRALAAGRSFFNITLRAAENIATGQIGEDGIRLTSPPQEDMVRILNWNQWFLTRFRFGEARHGQDFLEMSTERYQEFLRYKGAKLDVNKIVEFGGVDVKKMEDGSQYRTSGVFSGWRLENIAFKEIKFKDENGKMISIQEFRNREDIKKKKIGAITEHIKELKKSYPDKDPAEYVTEEDQRNYAKYLMPVVNGLDYGLSMLIKNQDFGAQDNKLGYLFRTEIWKKIAKTNTPLMIDYLTKIKYKPGTSPVAESMEELRDHMGSEWIDKNDEKAEKVKWEDFKKKILIKFERTIRQGMGDDLPPLPKEYELDADEQKLENSIKVEGEKLAPHLADIIFPYTPFMNDIPFEELQYKFAGQTFYKRRTTGDLGGYNKGQQALMKIVNNPGGIHPKEAIEAMAEIVEGIGGPEGVGAGMEANFPTFSALMDVVITEKGVRQGAIKMLLEAARKPTSKAQLWNGIKADSFTEPEAANMIDDTLRAGLLTPELARYLKKKKNLALWGILWALFRDVFPMIVAANLKDFVDASLVDLKAK